MGLLQEEMRDFRIEGELHPRGCAQLAQAVLTNALTSNRVNGRSWGFTSKAIRRRADMLIAFADSALVEHYSDVFGYDLVRIRQALIDRARELSRTARSVEIEQMSNWHKRGRRGRRDLRVIQKKR